MDPDGRDIKNTTSKYILGKLEDPITIGKDSNGVDIKLSFLIIAPGETVKGHFDGAILKDGTIIKVSAESKLNENVNFTILENDKGEVDFDFSDYASFCTDKKNNDIKGMLNLLPFCGEYDYSGKYSEQNKKGATLHKWWANASSPKECGTPENWDKNGMASEKQQKLRKEVEKKWKND